MAKASSQIGTACASIVCGALATAAVSAFSLAAGLSFPAHAARFSQQQIVRCLVPSGASELPAFSLAAAETPKKGSAKKVCPSWYAKCNPTKGVADNPNPGGTGSKGSQKGSEANASEGGGSSSRGSNGGKGSQGGGGDSGGDGGTNQRD